MKSIRMAITRLREEPELKMVKNSIPYTPKSQPTGIQPQDNEKATDLMFHQGCIMGNGQVPLPDLFSSW
jgi:hypothetical protein